VLLAIAGCTAHLVSKTDNVLPERFSVARPPLVIHSNFALPAHDQLMDELIAQRTDLGQRLTLPPTTATVHIWLFENAEEFQKFIRAKYPNFPDRRAFFVENDGQLAVYAQWGDRVAVDLRHEVTHAFLHSVVPNLPLWLDEGLAKYFELPRGQHGLNPQYLRQITLAVQKGVWHPNMRRLQRLDPAGDMCQEDYVESWAWVHYLLESQPAQTELLRHYLADLQNNVAAEPISSRLTSLVGHPEWALLEHMRKLAEATIPDAGNIKPAIELNRPSPSGESRPAPL